MKALLGFFVHRPLLVNVLVAFFFITGVVALFSLRYNSLPSVDTGAISVVTQYPGASVEDVELSVTRPLEREFLHIDGVDKVLSSSIEGQSTIQVFCNSDDEVDDYDRVEGEIYDAIDRARVNLPANLRGNPVITRPEHSKNIPLAEVLVTGSVPEDTLREYARRVQLELRNLEGVSGVTRAGYREREIRIWLDDVKLRQLGISHDQVLQAIQSRNVRDAGGSLESVTGEQDIITIGKFLDAREVEDVVVYEGRPGDFVRVRDIAQVFYDYADPVVRSSVQGGPAINLLVRANEKADRLSTALGVRDYIERRNRSLPGVVKLVLVNDDALATTAMLEVLVSNAIAGIILVILVLLCFFQFRLTIWVALGIPTSIMMVFAVMPLLGLTVNIITMSALILMLGILVDDAVVTAESIFRHHEYGMPAEQAAIEGTHKVMLPVVASAITTILALAPGAFMGGPQGKVFWLVPVMAIIVLVISLLECKFILPAHIAHSLRGGETRKLTRSWFQTVEDWYEAQMMRAIRHRYKFFFGTLFVLFAAAWLSTRVIVFVSTPTTDTDVIYVKAEGPIGTSFIKMESKLQALERELRELVPVEDLQAMVVTTGHHDHDIRRVTEGRDPSWGMIAVFLKPAQLRETSSIALRDELRARYAQREGYRALTVNVQQIGPRMGFPLETAIIGNSEQRFLAADVLVDFVRGIDGVDELWTDYTAGKPVISLRLDYDALKRYGLTVGEVSSAVKVAFNGKVIDTFETMEDTIVYRLMLDGVDTSDPASLYSLAVTNKAGNTILLRSLVEFEHKPGEGTVFHFLGDQATTVFASINRDLISTYELNARVAQFIRDERLTEQFPDLSFYQGGEMVSERAQAGESARAFLIAIVAIVFVLILLFHSALQPLMVLFMIPLGVVGVLVAFAVQNMVLSMAALMGIAGLMGVIVNDALVMLDRLNVEQALHSQRGQTLLHDRQIVECASVRLRPIVITTVTTCAGLFPAAYELGGSNELLTPMIMAMFWGVLIASVITLFLMPCMYAMERDLNARLHPDYARQALDEVVMYN